MIYVDVDHFKAINDPHGHRAGDRVLARGGRSMATALRRGDLPIRWGGEEFVALFPGVEAAGLAAAADRVRVLVANSWLHHPGTNGGSPSPWSARGPPPGSPPMTASTATAPTG